MRKYHLKINKGKFVRLLWDRFYRTTVHAAHFWKTNAGIPHAPKWEWFLTWKTPIGAHEARIYQNQGTVVLQIKLGDVIVRAEPLTESTLREYKFIEEE